MKNQGQGVAPGLERDNESIRDFISMAVHDLREPLRAIRLGSQLLEAKGERSEENIARGRRYVLDGAERMETLIRDIAEYCYEEVREHYSKETDMENVLREAQNELAAEIQEGGVAVTHDPLPVVPGDFPSLVTVLRCLIANACKFRREAAPSVHIAARQEASEWIFSVRDNGQGFSSAYSERIFKPFERLNGKQYPGSGLGLAIAQMIVERHGGRVWAESKLGEGSTFRFSLPLLG